MGGWEIYGWGCGDRSGFMDNILDEFFGRFLDLFGIKNVDNKKIFCIQNPPNFFQASRN